MGEVFLANDEQMKEMCMDTLKLNNRQLRPILLGIVLILTANICYYTEDSIPTYITLSGVGMLLIIFRYLRVTNYKIFIEPFIIWVTVLYTMYFIYGFLFSNGGLFNWDMLLFTYVSNIVLYLALRIIITREDWISILIKPIGMTVIIISILIFTNDITGVVVAENETRFGGSLSGNVNSVAVYLGVLSMFVCYHYAKTKNKVTLSLLFLCFAFMLLTGSKKAIIIILCDLFIYLKVSKQKALAFLVFVCAIVGGTIMVMQVPLLYNIIGHRVRDLFFQVFGIGTGSYSNASDMSSSIRKDLIFEALEIYLKDPLFYLTGGGWNAFSANSHYHNFAYYSHCNYTEMLCTFGLLGTSLYYFPLFTIYKKVGRLNASRDEYYFSMIITLMMFLLSFFMVIFSDVCIVYLPYIILFLLVKRGKLYCQSSKD